MAQAQSLSERWQSLQARIAAACARAGRDPAEVRVVAVSKGVPNERIAEAYALGLRDFGENYWQEARTKLDALPHDIRWHFIGHLQTNKVKYVVGRFALIQVVDRVSLLQEVQRVAQKRGIVQPVLIEVRLAEVPGRAGVSFEDAPALIEQTLRTEGVELQGLMGVAPEHGRRAHRARGVPAIAPPLRRAARAEPTLAVDGYDPRLRNRPRGG
jgi:pyridoxal phosphate enzyme (YggS family)